MEWKEIRRLGNEAFARGLRKLTKDQAPRDWPVVGFDTEYTSRKGELLSWQLADEEEGWLVEEAQEALTPESLAAHTYRARSQGRRKDVILVVYWSLAELRHLPVFARGTRFQEYARGSLDVTLESDDGTRLHIFDVSRFFDGRSMRQAAEAMGLRKLDWDTSKVTRSTLRKKRFREYAIHDAVCVRDIFLRMRDGWLREGVDIVRTATPAASAARMFRRNYLEEDVGLPPPPARRLALRGTWGGRAEAFHRGRWDTVYEYDLVSAYPTAVIQYGVMPRGRDWQPLMGSRIPSSWVGGYVRARFSYPRSERYPALPVHCDGAMVYPLKGETHCTIAEARVAREHGARLSILDGWGFRQGTDSLARMMRELRERREKAQGTERVVLKLAMNALIGKFVQHRLTPGIADLERTAKQHGVPLETFLGMSRLELQAWGLELKRKIGGSWCPEWGGLITGRVRAQLSDLIRRTRAVYCATDSVWTTEPLADDRDSPLKAQGPGIVARTRLGILGERTVHHAWTDRSEAREAILRGQSRRTYVWRRPLHAMAALAAEEAVGTWIETPREGSTDWDRKRELLEDGSTRPWRDIHEFREARA